MKKGAVLEQKKSRVSFDHSGLLNSWWRIRDSNPGHKDYDSSALTDWANPPKRLIYYKAFSNFASLFSKKIKNFSKKPSQSPFFPEMVHRPVSVAHIQLIGMSNRLGNIVFCLFHCLRHRLCLRQERRQSWRQRASRSMGIFCLRTNGCQNVRFFTVSQ